MSTPPVTLDQGPPLPPGLQPQPQQPTMQGLAGSPSPASGSASLQQTILQKLMFVEQSLDDIAAMMPDAAPVVGQLVTQLRQGMGAVLAKGAQPPPAPTGAGGGAQMMMPPQGSPTT